MLTWETQLHLRKTAVLRERWPSAVLVSGHRHPPPSRLLSTSFEEPPLPHVSLGPPRSRTPASGPGIPHLPPAWPPPCLKHSTGVKSGQLGPIRTNSSQDLIIRELASLFPWLGGSDGVRLEERAKTGQAKPREELQAGQTSFEA